MLPYLDLGMSGREGKGSTSRIYSLEFVERNHRIGRLLASQLYRLIVMFQSSSLHETRRLAA